MSERKQNNFSQDEYGVLLIIMISTNPKQGRQKEIKKR
jgi:hypothetical protein